MIHVEFSCQVCQFPFMNCRKFAASCCCIHSVLLSFNKINGIWRLRTRRFCSLLLLHERLSSSLALSTEENMIFFSSFLGIQCINIQYAAQPITSFNIVSLDNQKFFWLIINVESCSHNDSSYELKMAQWQIKMFEIFKKSSLKCQVLFTFVSYMF